MEKVRKLLTEQVDEMLIQLILSNPRVKDQVSKIKIRPIKNKDELFFQESSFVGTKVIHKNYQKDEMIEKIISDLESEFKQLELESFTKQATVLVSKKGTLTVKQKDKQVELSENDSRDLSHNRNKRYLLEEGVVVPFLVDLGVQTKDGKIVQSKYDKFRQINRFLELIRDIVPKLPQDRKVSIIDFGCGKSYLTFALYYYLTVLQNLDIDVVGLDLKEDVIKKCNELKDSYGYKNLQFLQGDIREYNEKEEVDMVVTLHACDTATDYALAKAVSWNAKVILSVPRCQHELNAQISCEMLQPILKYGLLKERMSALLTDGIRANFLEAAGYETQVLEFIDMEHTPKNILIRGVKKGFVKKASDMDAMLDFLNAKPKLKELL